MNERSTPNDLTAEERRRLSEYAERAGDALNDNVAAFSISEDAVNHLEERLGYPDDDYNDPYFIATNAKIMAEDFYTSIYHENPESGLLAPLGDCLADEYGEDVDKINSFLVGMWGAAETIGESNGDVFLTGLKRLSEHDVVDTFSEFGKVTSKRTLIERSTSAKIPSYGTGNFNKLLIWLYSDFQTVDNTGEQLRDGAEFGYFLANRNADKIRDPKI